MGEAEARLLASTKTEERIRAVQRLSASGEPDALPLLVGALRDRSSYVAGLAAAALAEAAPWDLCGDLLAAFEWAMASGAKRDPGCTVRLHLASALGRHAYAMASQAMRTGIRTVQVEYVGGLPVDTAAPLRGVCAQALAAMRDPEALRDIALLLFDLAGDPQSTASARVGAARALAMAAEPAAATLLAVKLQAGQGEAPEVLTECMGALIALEDERAHEALIPYLDHPEPAMAAFAAMTLSRTRRAEAARAIAARLERFQGDLLETVLLALARCGVPEAVDAVEREAAVGRPAVRRAARKTLEALGLRAADGRAGA